MTAMRSRILLGLLLVTAAGCARNARPEGSPAEPETPRYEHIFLLPMEETLAQTRKLLAEKGYAVEPTEDPSMLLTTWQVPMGPSQGNGTYSRYFVSLDLSYAQGRRWGCDLDSKDKLQCHVFGATPADRVAERPGLAPYVKLLPQATEEGYHGLLYVGALSPSPPATSLAVREPPPASGAPNAPKTGN